MGLTLVNLLIVSFQPIKTFPDNPETWFHPFHQSNHSIPLTLNPDWLVELETSYRLIMETYK